MSIEHLERLKKALEQHKWVVVDERPGNNYEISAFWRVARPNGDSEFVIAFEGLDDLETLPIENSYGCHIVGNKEVSLYFGKIGRSFPNNLSKFLEALERVKI
jgi:hypothetical protein